MAIKRKEHKENGGGRNEELIIKKKMKISQK